jgi:ABC-type glutathione transport system ATPase component
MGLVPVQAGRVLLDGADALGAGRGARRRMRRRAQMIFQDPGGSLDPRMRVGDAVGEPLRVHRVARGGELRRRVSDLLARCGLDPAMGRRHPHELSGGERQRVAIARALSLEPALLLCDEPTSALDASVQAQILNLLRDLQRDRGLAYLFISHDMGVVAHMCDRIAVMSEGRIVECGPRESVLSRPSHACTRRLIACCGADIPGDILTHRPAARPADILAGPDASSPCASTSTS